MTLIVGLGNPGKKYEATRHNLGFRVVDALAARWELGAFEARFEGLLAKGRAHEAPVMLLKPQTYMNLSGASIAACARYHKIAPENIWVIHDELDLPLARLRIREGGSGGGHNGVRSIIESLGTQEFVRFRLGVGRPEEGGAAVEDYVLQPFPSEAREAVEAAIARTADAVETALKEGLTRAMNEYNA